MVLPLNPSTITDKYFVVTHTILEKWGPTGHTFKSIIFPKKSYFQHLLFLYILCPIIVWKRLLTSLVLCLLSCNTGVALIYYENFNF